MTKLVLEGMGAGKFFPGVVCVAGGKIPRQARSDVGRRDRNIPASDWRSMDATPSEAEQAKGGE